MILLTADKLKDPEQLMVKAEQRGAEIVKFFIKFFGIICPISLLGNVIGSVCFSYWKYGHLNPKNIYRIYRFTYVATP